MYGTSSEWSWSLAQKGLNTFLSEKFPGEDGAWACRTPSAPATLQRGGRWREACSSECGVGREGGKVGEGGCQEEVDCEAEGEVVHPWGQNQWPRERLRELEEES